MFLRKEYFSSIDYNEPVKSVFVSGYYHTGTRWLHQLIKENCEEHVVTEDHHRFILNDEEIHHGKSPNFLKFLFFCSQLW